MSLVIEAIMLFKIKAVRHDLRESSRSTRFLILLISNKLSDCGWEGDAHAIVSYVQSRNAIENK
jgi:hypothetical protein